MLLASRNRSLAQLRYGNGCCCDFQNASNSAVSSSLMPRADDAVRYSRAAYLRVSSGNILSIAASLQGRQVVLVTEALPTYIARATGHKPHASTDRQGYLRHASSVCAR